MRTVSRVVIVGAALAPFALVMACSDGGASTVGGGSSTVSSTATGTGAGGAGGEGGEGSTGGAGGAGEAGGAGGQGGSVQLKEVEVFKCDTISETPAAEIIAEVDYTYNPSEVTLNAGEVLRFEPSTPVQNMESGVDEIKDGKFHTQQGAERCLRFNVAGTYPFFSLGTAKPMAGTVYVK